MMFKLKEIVRFKCKCGSKWFKTSPFICRFCKYSNNIFNLLEKEEKDAKGIP